MSQKEREWDTIIEPQHNLFTLNFKAVWQYRDLLLMFVKRDFVTFYKQTILGPIWFFLQPIFTTLTYVIIFGQLAGISTDGLPQILFYLLGVTTWNYFADGVNKVSTVFRDHQSIFGKVYFPRLIIPLSIVISNLLKFGIQFGLFLLFLGYYIFFTDVQIAIRPEAVLAPIFILIMAALGLGLGMIITSLTTKYRDLVFLLTFGIQLFMYATPVIYPLSVIPEKYQWLVMLNPMTGILEGFRYGFLGQGSFSWELFAYSVGVTAILFFIGIIIFNKTEKNFMDTV